MKDTHKLLVSAIFIDLLLIIMFLTIYILLDLYSNKKRESQSIVQITEITETVYNVEQPIQLNQSSELKQRKTTDLEYKKLSVNKIVEISKLRCTYGQAENIYKEVLLAEDRYGIPKELIFGLISQESQFYIYAKNKKSNATGLMQICPPALKDYNAWNGTDFELSDMYDVHNNIEVGVWNYQQQGYYLRNDSPTYTDMIISYNTGVGDFKRYKDYWYDEWNVKKNSYYGYLTNVKYYGSVFTELGIKYYYD